MKRPGRAAWMWDMLMLLTWSPERYRFHIHILVPVPHLRMAWLLTKTGLCSNVCEPQGYSEAQLKECLEEYASLNVWQIHPNTFDIHFIDAWWEAEPSHLTFHHERKDGISRVGAFKFVTRVMNTIDRALTRSNSSSDSEQQTISWYQWCNAGLKACENCTSRAIVLVHLMSSLVLFFFLQSPCLTLKCMKHESLTVSVKVLVAKHTHQKSFFFNFFTGHTKSFGGSWCVWFEKSIHHG
jgi:hypothetical protein